MSTTKQYTVHIKAIHISLVTNIEQDECASVLSIYGVDDTLRIGLVTHLPVLSTALGSELGECQRVEIYSTHRVSLAQNEVCPARHFLSRCRPQHALHFVLFMLPVELALKVLKPLAHDAVPDKDEGHVALRKG
jgi:hypothetical protein